MSDRESIATFYDYWCYQQKWKARADKKHIVSCAAVTTSWREGQLSSTLSHKFHFRLPKALVMKYSSLVTLHIFHSILSSTHTHTQFTDTRAAFLIAENHEKFYFCWWVIKLYSNFLSHWMKIVFSLTSFIRKGYCQLSRGYKQFFSNYNAINNLWGFF